ncbi:MAG: SDR family NAD(P)-dependent oxidoreductase, partial [Bacteroidota bacterium]
KQFVLITGVSSGIGLDTTRFLIGKGYHVFGSVRSDEDQTMLETEFKNGFTCLRFDVRDKEAILAAAEIVQAHLGNQPLTALINNAGLSIPGPMALIPDEQFRLQLEVNLIGVRLVTNVFLPMLGMREKFQGKPGKIINVSSLSGIFNSPLSGSYCVSKHALESLGEIYRRELMQFGIDVVSIQPGPIQSDIWQKNIGIMKAYEGTAYHKIAVGADQFIANAEKSALPASAIAKLIYRILHKKRPAVSYMVSKKIWMMHIAKRLPSRIMDRLMWKRLNQ